MTDYICSQCNTPAGHVTRQTSTHPKSGVTVRTAIWYCPKCGKVNTHVEEVKS